MLVNDLIEEDRRVSNISIDSPVIDVLIPLKFEGKYSYSNRFDLCCSSKWINV